MDKVECVGVSSEGVLDCAGHLQSFHPKAPPL